jgi:hypothetical protein
MRLTFSIQQHTQQRHSDDPLFALHRFEEPRFVQHAHVGAETRQNDTEQERYAPEPILKPRCAEAKGLGCVNTKSDLVVMPSGRQIFYVFLISA